jgi:uncharacterized protein YcbK (DUF882 family)
MDRFACPCCGKNEMKEEALKAFECLESIVGPLKVNSAYRCEKHNRSLNGALKSYHLVGQAFDIPYTNTSKRVEFIKAARKAGYRGIIIYKWGFHLDIRVEEYTAVK